MKYRPTRVSHRVRKQIQNDDSDGVGKTRRRIIVTQIRGWKRRAVALFGLFRTIATKLRIRVNHVETEVGYFVFPSSVSVRRKPSWRAKRVYFENVICDVRTCALFTTYTHTHIYDTPVQTKPVSHACMSVKDARHEFNNVVYSVYSILMTIIIIITFIVVGTRHIYSDGEYLTRKNKYSVIIVRNYCWYRAKSAFRREREPTAFKTSFTLCVSPILCRATKHGVRSKHYVRGHKLLRRAQ